MLYLLDNEEGMLKVIESLYYGISNKITSVTIRNFTKLQRSRYACYGVCWPKNNVTISVFRWIIIAVGTLLLSLVLDAV